MGLDHNSVGHQTEVFEFEYDWKAVVLYALGIGATTEDLDYVYEGRGPKVFPTFALAAAYEPVESLIDTVGLETESMVHGAQSRKHQHGNVRRGWILLDLTADLVTVHAGHLNVEDEQVGMVNLGLADT